MSAIADAFLHTRADHLPPDVFSQFIVPPFFERISIFADKKSVRILGGRGCGKTMFIRYFSHGTAFSVDRRQIGDEELAAVGLYFRPDTGFCSLMTGEWLGAREAKLAFSHYVALNLLGEACRSLESISQADLTAGTLDLRGLRIGPALIAQLELGDATAAALASHVELQLSDLELWVRNPRSRTAPTFLSFASVLPRLAADVAKSSPRLASFAFRAFIDEFENLQEGHREVICDAIKHPDLRLAVHIAHKREAVTDFKTSSEERVVEFHDLRTIDLEGELSETSEFQLLAAELFLLRVHQAGGPLNCVAFRPELLHDPRHLPHRLTEAYRRDVLRAVRSILPTPSSAEIAREVVGDSALRRRLTEMLDKGLALQGLKATVAAEALIDDQRPEASIVLGALLNRTSQNGAVLLEQFAAASKTDRPEIDPFFKVGGWVDNNLYGCLFHLYAGLPRRANILFAGFDRFCQLANPNLRFFQELCHTTLLLAFQRRSGEEITAHLTVDAATQATAAKQVSDALFEDILQLGQYGDRLLEITRRLGLMFEAFNRRRSQSEPEINHFSIDHADRVALTIPASQLIREAKIWSVLYEEKDTKNKTDYDVAQSDLILNRIFAPHFNISYRKRRKITLKARHVEVLLCQSASQFESVLKQLVDQSDPGAASLSGELF